MKNHKGAIATLLTLGLVVVGALITLGTSLFVNNQNTNLASNSMAAINCNGPKTCPNGKKYYQRGAAGDFFQYPGCSGEVNYNSYCKGGSAAPSNTPVPGGGGGGSSSCPYKNTVDATNKCKPNGYTNVGCKGKTYKCKPAPEADDEVADDSTTTSSGGGSGEVGPGQSCCFRKKGLIYVYGRYDDMVNGEMNLNCAAHSVERSYQADGPAFVCSGGIQNQTPEDEIDPADLDGSGTEVVPVNACEDQGYTCVDTVGKSPYTACSPDQYIKGVSCGDTTKACCTGPGGGTVGGGTTEPISRTGKLGEPCLYGTFQGRANTYYCVSPGVACLNGICVASQTDENEDLPTTNNTDDQKCINAFKTPYAYCGRRPCSKQDNVGGKVTGYKPTNYACGYVFRETYNCCIRQDMQADLTLAPTNKFQPTSIPETGDEGDDQKCKDKFGDYSYCTMGLGCITKEDINGKVYQYVRSDYACNTNVGSAFYCCKLKDYIAGSSVSISQEVVTQNGERGALINIQGRGIVFSNL